MKRILIITAALVLVAVPVIAQTEYIPPADAVVIDMGISDGTNINPVGTLYCVPADPR